MPRFPSPVRALAAAALAGGALLGAARPLPAQVAESEYASRRAALAAAIGDGAFVAFGAGEPAHDYERFEQTPNFQYLTGIREPGAALLMLGRGGRAAATLFVEERDPEQEVWSGRRAGVAETTRRTGVPARPARELGRVLDSLAGAGVPLRVAGEQGSEGVRSRDEQRVDLLRRKHPALRVSNVNGAVEQLRGRKSAAELALIRRAVEITVAAQREAMALIEPDVNEFEAQAIIEYTFRRNGADRPSFATIVGSGPNSTTLHYNADDRFMRAGEVVVMDVGASYRGYAADVTRTVPVSGTFTPAQREIYQLVRDAQAAAERQAKPGAAAALMSDSASATLAAGLARLGLIEGPEATYDCDAGGARQCPQLGLYYMHGLGHGIGLEVHDPEQYYFTGRLDVGSAFTLEPGVYVRADLLDILPRTPRNRALAAKIGAAVAKYRDVGVRIEDDYVVTEQGVEWLSRAPREAAEVEAAMRGPFAGPAKRNPALVDAYRATQ